MTNAPSEKSTSGGGYCRRLGTDATAEFQETELEQILRLIPRFYSLQAGLLVTQEVDSMKPVSVPFREEKEGDNSVLPLAKSERPIQER